MLGWGQGRKGHGQKAQFTLALTEPPPARNSRYLEMHTEMD